MTEVNDQTVDNTVNTEQVVNGKTEDEDLINKWAFDDWTQLYKIAIKFFRENESKAFHPSYDTRNRFMAYILQEKYGNFDPTKAKPLGPLDIIGKDRRNSWISLSNTTQLAAQKGFIRLLDDMCPLFEPYVSAIKVDFDEKQRLRKEAEELELKRIEELKEKERIDSEIKRKQEEQMRQLEEQKRAIQEALNRQTYQQFKTYAEQQYPDDIEQQNSLIRQLQEQHYQQYLLQINEQESIRSHQTTTPNNNKNNSVVSNQSQTQMESTNTSQSNSLVYQKIQLERQPTPEDDNHNNHLEQTTTSDTDSDSESIGPIAGASMWTRKDIAMFKESIRSEGGDGIIKVGHGEIVTVRVPTHKDGTCIFWEFSTDSYDIGFGLLFEWTKNPGNQVSVHISESEDEEDEEEEGDSVANDIEKGAGIEAEKESLSPKSGQTESPPISVIIPIYRRDSHEEVFAGSHAYPEMCEVLPQTTDKLTDHLKIDSRDVSITEDEAALYDRQIRLWGVSAQKRLRSADVLMAGINGIGSEVVKNIVLCGVNSITLLDDQTVNDYDTASNLFTKRKIGANRAEASREAIQSLNPMVSVKCDTTCLKDKDKDFFNAFDVVIVANYDKQTMIRVNQFCNDLNKKFFAVCNWGLFGFSFTDLGSDYTYFSEEDIKKEEETVSDGYEPLKKKAKIEENTKQIVEKKVSFVRLEAALAVRAGKSGYGLTKRTNSTFIITHVLLEFCSKYSRYPSADSREEDIKQLETLEKEVIERLGLDPSIIKTKEWHKYVFGELSPVCAIVGGVLAQDVIRAISAKDTPIRNFFLFDGIQCNGIIESIGK